MKKVLFLGAFALISLASCKKDYTCECTTTANGASSSASVTINDTKSNAEESCKAQGSATAGSANSTVSCEIVD